MPTRLDQASLIVPFLTDWGTPPWPSDLAKPPQQVPSQNPGIDMNSHFMNQPPAQSNGFISQPTQNQPLPGFFTNPTGSVESSDFTSSLYLASPPNSVKSDDSLRLPSMNHSPPMLSHSPPSMSLTVDSTAGIDLADLNPTEAAGIKLEKELSPQASYDPRFLTSNPAPITDSTPPQIFNSLFNPTEPPIASQQDSSENSSLSSSEEDASGVYQDPATHPPLVSDANSRFHRSPRLAAPIPVPNLTKKSRGRRVPTAAFLLEDGVERARPFACIVPGCGKCFARGEHLKRHVRSIHTNEKPHKCPVPSCGKEFSRNDNLCQHMRVHKGYRHSDLH